MSDLRSDLKEIKGVGDSTADSILEVLDNHEQDALDIQGILQDALDYHQQEDYGFSEQYLQEALDKL